MSFKLVGSILLIVGTTIGAGMLALPIATAKLGFFGSLILLIGCWLLMTSSAFLMLEANLWLPLNSNIISMSKATLGRIGQVVAWLTYFLLLYSLLSAYIASGSDVFHHLLMMRGIHLSSSQSSILFTLIFGSVVCLGIRSVDYVNRGLMIVKLGSYLIAVLLLMPYVEPLKLAVNKLNEVTIAAVMVTITSFGFAIIIPSLRVYFASDVKKLRLAILIGSLIPLFCYIAWDIAIMGIIPLEGSNGLVNMLHSQKSTSDLVNTLSMSVQHQTIAMFTQLFTSVCVLTSFLGVSLCLSDFLADGFHVEKKGWGNMLIYAATFLPPLIIVFYFPGVFIKALQYAGIYCVILLILFPALMVWRGRYHCALAKGYQVFGGKALLSVLIALSIIMIGFGIIASVITQ